MPASRRPCRKAGRCNAQCGPDEFTAALAKMCRSCETAGIRMPGFVACNSERRASAVAETRYCSAAGTPASPFILQRAIIDGRNPTCLWTLPDGHGSSEEGSVSAAERRSSSRFWV